VVQGVGLIDLLQVVSSSVASLASGPVEKVDPFCLYFLNLGIFISKVKGLAFLCRIWYGGGGCGRREWGGWLLWW